MTTIRPARDSDTTAVLAVTARAFAHHVEVTDLVTLLAAGPARVALVAEDEAGTVVGHTMLSRGWIDAPRELVETLILSPLSVDPPVQRQGIGTALVRAALKSAESLGANAVFLEGDPRYYSRLGFVAGASRGFIRPSVRIPEPGFQVVVLPAWRDWMTGALVYPEAFWATGSVGPR